MTSPGAFHHCNFQVSPLFSRHVLDVLAATEHVGGPLCRGAFCSPHGTDDMQRKKEKKKCDCRALVDLGALAGFEATIQPRASLVCSVDVHWLPSRDPAMILLVASIEPCLHRLILLFSALLPILEGSRLFSSSQRRHPRATAGILKCLDLHAFQLPSPSMPSWVLNECKETLGRS
ncbi:hypothetical protein CI102_14316 [Trichoderma harzianum]|uniref:Uncharacterized protein n=1 Tax=Trichoderma harzianum CBS 226.95 TaxID=983964 RepID=A0A2T4AF64_TRIHA|nr:hypothetical protein M431DRAFT_407808 [Trichoderma harzianum CBS 226.95]PKK43259.1 hypothetical protein CI102_14316 [Trichoderma harzianum]PTB55735.1 hypothetical protein M431DRAFT_407808 [Trichoderma harzianum CBS 226.95]